MCRDDKLSEITKKIYWLKQEKNKTKIKNY